MKFYEALLTPFSVLYDGITRFRNHLYNIEYKKSVCFDTVVINVGNLAVGGTGKSPMIEYLVRMLNDRYKLAVLSRGYGRRTRGFRLAAEQDSAATLGDEPYQFYWKWKEELTVAVGEERALAIPTILHERPETQVILLDDAYQHRSVQPDFNILLTTFQRPFYSDFVLPAGRLREARKGAARANAVVVTKCPENLTKAQKQQIKEAIRDCAGAEAPVYFSRISYHQPVALFNANEKIKTKVVLLSGIANADLFEKWVVQHYEMLAHFRFGDHHRYTKTDLETVITTVVQEPHSFILTTEKDAVKLIQPEFKALLEDKPVFYLPIQHVFDEGATEFEEQIVKTIEDKIKSLS